MTNPVPTLCQDFHGYMDMCFCQELPPHKKNGFEFIGDIFVGYVSWPFHACGSSTAKKVSKIFTLLLLPVAGCLFFSHNEFFELTVLGMKALPWFVYRTFVLTYTMMGIMGIALRAFGIISNNRAIEAYYEKYPAKPIEDSVFS